MVVLMMVVLVPFGVITVIVPVPAVVSEVPVLEVAYSHEIPVVPVVIPEFPAFAPISVRVLLAVTAAFDCRVPAVHAFHIYIPGAFFILVAMPVPVAGFGVFHVFRDYKAAGGRSRGRRAGFVPTGWLPSPL